MKKWIKGFTLVEILVVVAIIAAIATIMVPNIIRNRVLANDAVTQKTLKTIAIAMETYLGINHAYPTDTDVLMGEAPPYLNKDYFTGTQNGFTYAANLTTATYDITATPVSSNFGTASYTVSTGGVLIKN